MRNPLALLRHKFMRDAATLQGANFIMRASQAASAVAVAYVLGSEGQGLFVSAGALQALLYFLITVGVSQTTMTQVAAAAARKNDDKLCGWIAFIAKLGLVFGVGMLTFGLFVMPHVGDALRWLAERLPFISGDWLKARESSSAGDMIWIWAGWLCLQPLLEVPRIVAVVAFQGTRRMRHVAQTETGQEAVRFFLVVLGALITNSPAGAVIGVLAASAIGSTLALEQYRTARREGGEGHPLPSIAAILRRMPSIPLRPGLRQGLRVAFLKNGTALVANVLPRLFIFSVGGARWVSYFHIAQKILEIPMSLLQGVVGTLLPALSEAAGLKDMQAFRRLFGRTTFIAGASISSLILISLPLIRPVVGAAFPPDYEDHVFVFACILALGYIPFSFAAAVFPFYIVANRLKVNMAITIAGAVVTIPANVWLILNVPYYGTAWGLSVYLAWPVLHLVYAFSFLRRHRTWGSWVPPEGGPAPAPEGSGSD